MSVLPLNPHRLRPLVVVAEDGDAERTMVGFMLEVSGFDVVLTVDGLDALDAVRVHCPDAVVSDMNMPNLDGLGLCRALRALPTAAATPVILWSSVDAEDVRLRESIALGGVEFLSKAVVVTRIDSVLRQLLPAHWTFPHRPPVPAASRSQASRDVMLEEDGDGARHDATAGSN